MGVEGKYVRMAEMVRATGHSVETIKKYVNNGRIKATFINGGGKRYLLPKKEIAYSLAGARKIKENKIMEKDGVLIPVTEYIKRTGLPNSTTYEAIKVGWLPSEKNEDNKLRIRWFNKTKNLTLFKEARDGYHNDEIVTPANNAVEEALRKKSETVKIGTMLPTKMWCELAGYAYSSMQRQVRMGVLDDCSLKMSLIGGGDSAKRFIIEWPGFDKAIEVRSVLMTRAQVVDKQYRINLICNTVDDVEVVETEVETEAPIAEPEPTPEPIPESPPASTPPEFFSGVDIGVHNALDARVKKLEAYIEKSILEKAGYAR